MERKPKKVEEARLKGNADALSTMGRNGNLQARINHALAEKRRLEMLEAGMWQNHIQANEHIVTPDGEEGEFPDGIIRAA